MGWQSRFASIYLIVCKVWDQGLKYHQETDSNNHSSLSDEEVLTIFLFGVLSGHRSVKAVYWFTRNHLHGWFPGLKSYEAYNYRLGRLSGICPIFLEALLRECFRLKGKHIRRIIDSFPIIMAKEKHSSKGRVARQLAAKGYCSSRGEYYYGVKVHVIGVSKDGGIPLPETVQITSANIHGLTLPMMHDPTFGSCT